MNITVMGALLRLCCILALLTAAPGCSSEDTESGQAGPAAAPAAAPPVKGCTDCHPFTVDARHAFGCTACHGGQDGASREEAHTGLVAAPAHPDSMMENCGGCHAAQVDSARHSLHFTLKKEVNAVRRVFGADEPLDSLVDIPIHEETTTVLDLADDMLRRRCLRCHVYSSGDVYPGTVRGTGCAACHLEYRGGALVSHAFVKSPPDSQCLHCHYGNQVGADYYGRFEHDFGNEFRTPYRTDDVYPRPYGVEFHQLAPDIHQQKGMACIDCHSGAELMGGTGTPAAGITCAGCHDWKPGERLPLDTLRVDKGTLALTTKLGGQLLTVPQLRHEAHRLYGREAACTVCHAQWIFNDKGTHLILYEAEDYDPWENLIVQGSYEVEKQLRTNLYGEGKGFEVPFMRDKITGEPYLGIWFKGYELRRWEEILVGRDTDGRLKVFRPILDLHLSSVDVDENVVFDSVGAVDPRQGLRPYTPHTIGRAGQFYRQRLRANVLPEKDKEK